MRFERTVRVLFTRSRAPSCRASAFAIVNPLSRERPCLAFRSLPFPAKLRVQPRGWPGRLTHISPRVFFVSGKIGNESAESEEAGIYGRALQRDQLLRGTRSVSPARPFRFNPPVKVTSDAMHRDRSRPINALSASDLV